MEPRYPNITVVLSDTDGNAFAVLGKMSKALRQAQIPYPERDAFTAEATSGDYDHLLQTCMKWVNVE
jgi:hypothetical protein